MDPRTDYSQAGEARLRAYVETVMGGRVVHMERQVRWRPAWFVDVERDGEILHLHLRGDREGDVAIFKDLRREGDVISVLSDHGIAVPRVYGFCEAPAAILMDAIPGTRDMADAPSDEARRSITRDYMRQMAAMHRLPLEPFIAKGVRLPAGGDEIALAGLHAYLPHYERTRCRPEPMLEFVLGWIRRNVPPGRDRAAFIQFDSGQFLHKDGALTGLYDFEFSMIGDPVTDFATMRMRDSYEPMGDDLRTLRRHYEEFSGAPLDDRVIEFHTLLFATLGTMQFTGTVGGMQAGDPHNVYLEFDIALRQVILLAMGALTGFTLPPEPPLTPRVGDNAAVIAKLADTLARIETASPMQQSLKESADQLLEWLACAGAQGEEVRRRNLADVSALLSRSFADWPEADAALEAYVKTAPPEADERLYRLFGAMEARRMLMFGATKIGRSATHVKLPPI